MCPPCSPAHSQPPAPDLSVSFGEFPVISFPTCFSQLRNFLYSKTFQSLKFTSVSNLCLCIARLGKSSAFSLSTILQPLPSSICCPGLLQPLQVPLHGGRSSRRGSERTNCSIICKVKHFLLGIPSPVPSEGVGGRAGLGAGMLSPGTPRDYI